MLLLVMGVGFDNTCTVSWKEMSPGLFQDFMVDHSVVVMSARLNSMGSQFWISVL